MLFWCEVSAMCAALLAALLILHPPHTGKPWHGSRLHWPRSAFGLLLLTLLAMAGQWMPPVLLWMAWRRTYFLIPFLGPPIHVGVGPVWWAVSAVCFSYVTPVVYAAQRRQRWVFVALHPVGTLLDLVQSWRAVFRDQA